METRSAEETPSVASPQHPSAQKRPLPSTDNDHSFNDNADDNDQPKFSSSPPGTPSIHRPIHGTLDNDDPITTTSSSSSSSSSTCTRSSCFVRSITAVSCSAVLVVGGLLSYSGSGGGGVWIRDRARGTVVHGGNPSGWQHVGVAAHDSRTSVWNGGGGPPVPQKVGRREEENDEGEGGDDRDQEDEKEDDKDDENDRDEEDDKEDDKDEEEEDDKDKDEEEEDDKDNDRDKDDEEKAPGEDDFFYENLADDYVSENNINVGEDDFYAYVGEPTPPEIWPLTEREIVGYLIASAALTLGASGGIGGGGIVVPVYLLVMDLSPKVAIPVGAVTVLGGALSSTIVNFSRRHPLADRPIIDWDLVLALQPVVLVGVVLGTFIHQLLSEQVLIVLLVLLLSVTAHTTLRKAMRMYEAENRYIRHLKEAMAEPPTGSPSRTFTWGDGDKDEGKQQNGKVDDDEEKERIRIENPDFVTLRSDLLEEEKFTPNSKILVVFCTISVLIVLNVMVGGGGIESPWGIVCGSAAFWVIHVILICFLIASAWAAQAYLIARHEIKNIVRFDYVHGDIRWNRRAGWLYPVVFMVAGLLAGMFGIGGGIIIVPLLLTIGTHPAVASSTSSAMVLFTSLASTSTYFVFGIILLDFAAVGFIVAFCSSLVGQLIMGRIRQARSASGRRFERNSYIAFVIGGVVLVSALLMTIQYIFSIVDGPEDDFGTLCDGLRF